MTLHQWIEQQGRGAITRLAYKTQLAYTTVLSARDPKIGTSYDTAKKLSEATGGAVTVEDILEPRPPDAEPSAA